MSGSVLARVQSDISARVAMGALQYGEPLTTFNKRNALQDAYEEVLDLCNYLRQDIEEQLHPGRRTEVLPLVLVDMAEVAACSGRAPAGEAWHEYRAAIRLALRLRARMGV